MSPKDDVRSSPVGIQKGQRHSPRFAFHFQSRNIIWHHLCIIWHNLCIIWHHLPHAYHVMNVTGHIPWNVESMIMVETWCRRIECRNIDPYANVETYKRNSRNECRSVNLSLYMRMSKHGRSRNESDNAQSLCKLTTQWVGLPIKAHRSWRVATRVRSWSRWRAVVEWWTDCTERGGLWMANYGCCGNHHPFWVC